MNTPNISKYVMLKYLSGDDLLLPKFIKDVILPSGSNDNVLTKIQAVVLYMLKNKHLIRLPVLIFKHIKESYKNKRTSSLPFCGLASKIMLRWDMISPGEMLATSSIPLGKSVIVRQQSCLVGDRLIRQWQWEYLTNEERVVFTSSQPKNKRKRRNTRNIDLEIGGSPPRQDKLEENVEGARDTPPQWVHKGYPWKSNLLLFLRNNGDFMRKEGYTGPKLKINSPSSINFL